MARPQKPYETTYQPKEIIGGLCHQPDGRWRIIATGERFTESDERRAVQKFKDWQAKNQSPSTTRLAIPSERAALAQIGKPGAATVRAIIADVDGSGSATYEQDVDTAGLWLWMREQLIADALLCARMTGIPELASLRNLPLPKPAIRLQTILDNFEQHNPSSAARAKRQRIQVFKSMMKFLDAVTLDDLSQNALFKWRQSIETSPTIKSAGTKAWIYGTIKAILSFSLKMPGMDSQQITAALSRCKVLWTPDAAPAPKPQPISREHFHTLLATGNGTWRAWLLVGLNLCLHLDEVCHLEWKDLDLTAGTYACIRAKTKRDRIPRAAVLWPETIAAIKAIVRKGPKYVFTSSHGTKYNRNTRGNDFKDLRELAELPDTITFDTLRDGAYTAAINDKTVEERFARVLAGHSSPGLQDSYVLRNPSCTADACKAVYAAYGPFPAK